MSGEQPDRAAVDHDAREQAILATARDTLPGDTPADVRRRFLETVGRADLIDAEPPSRRVIFRARTDGTVILTFELRSAVDVRHLLEWAGPTRPALVNWSTQFVRAPARRRARRRDAETIARALSIHYLSVQGGGRLTLTRAAARYRAAGLAWRETWAPERRRVVGEIERDIGPLWLSPGEPIAGA